MPRHAEAIAKTDEPEFRSAARIGLLDVLRQWPDAVARAVIIAVALVLAWHTWARWGSLEVDCGKALYVPVEILRGKLLYRDLWYPYGPLTPYLLAGLIGLFGQHLNVLYCLGIGLAIGCALLLYQIGTALGARAAGLVAALALLIRAFGDKQFNYPFPYSYAAPLALFLSLICAWLTVEYLLEPASRKLMAAGVMAGLVLLCKPEFGAACYLMLAFAICVAAIAEGRWRSLLLGAVRCAPGLLPSVIIYGWFCWRLGYSFVLQGNLQAMPGSYFLSTYATNSVATEGLRFVPAETTYLIISAALGLLIWFLIGKGACQGRDRVGGGLFVSWLVILIGGTAAARYGAAFGNPSDIVYPVLLALPPGIYFIGCVYLLYLLRGAFRRKDRHALAEAVFTLFALTLAVRVMVMAVGAAFAIFYGPPLILVFMLVLARCFRAASKRMSEARGREFVNVLFVVEAVLLAIIFVPGPNLRNVPLRTSWGTIYLTLPKAAVFRPMLDFISEQKRLGRRVIVLPELTGFYAFTGTEASSRWYMSVPGYPPPEAETGYIEALKKAAPAYIIISNEETRGYGVPYFGLDYNRKIYRWIEANYRTVGQFGNFRREKRAPLAALIYERKSAARLRR